MNSKDVNIKVSSSQGILSKIINIIKNIFKKDNIRYISAGNTENIDNKNDNQFFKSIKFEEDPDKAMLIKIQDELEKKGINIENAYNLTKDLTEIQKEKLESLYIEQIKSYEVSIENYKKRILKMRKVIAQTNN